VELVAGSGVYILAYRLQEARREAKTGTQLARKLMDCFWDKETLAKSTLTPRSKFQYQQLDPKIIKAIEGIISCHIGSYITLITLKMLSVRCVPQFSSHVVEIV
jgi:hypothetical protein